MDIVKMVWYCADCDKEFNRKAGQHHSIHSDHHLQRQLLGFHKKPKNELLSTDDIDAHKSDDVEKRETNYNTRKTITLHEKRFDSRRIMKNAFLKFVKEEQEANERFLSWIRQKKEEFVIRSRFGEDFTSQSQED